MIQVQASGLIRKDYRLRPEPPGFGNGRLRTASCLSLDPYHIPIYPAEEILCLGVAFGTAKVIPVAGLGQVWAGAVTRRRQGDALHYTLHRELQSITD